MAEFLAGARDVAIIVLAVLAIVQVFLLLMITLLIYKKIGPLMDTAQRSMTNVQATTAMVSDMTVSPIIRLAGMAAGAKTVASTLMGRGSKGKGGKK